MIRLELLITRHNDREPGDKLTQPSVSLGRGLAQQAARSSMFHQFAVRLSFNLVRQSTSIVE